jgi:hypothetical protein
MSLLVVAAVLLLFVLASLMLVGVAVLVVRAMRPRVGAPAAMTPRDSGSGVALDARPPVRGVVWRWAGVVVGAVVAYVTALDGPLGRGLLFAAPLFGLCALAGTLAGELIGPPPDGPVRRAQLRVRRIRDYASRGFGMVVLTATGVLFMLAAVTTATGSADDLGRAGRSLTCVNGPLTASHGPWPGSFYTLPGLGLVLAGLVLAALTLRRIALRPQPADTAAADDDLRRHSTDLVLSATGILVLVPLLGIALTASGNLMALAHDCGHAWWINAGWTLSGLAGVALVLTVWCVGRLLRPGIHFGAAG